MGGEKDEGRNKEERNEEKYDKTEDKNKGMRNRIQRKEKSLKK